MSAQHRIILRGEAEHWDRVFAARPLLTHVDVISWPGSDGQIERYIDVYDREHSTPLGISAMSAGSELKELLEECWSMDYPQDFEPEPTLD